GRWPRPPSPSAVAWRATPRRWVGGHNESSVKLSQVNGLGAEALSQVPPTPPAAPRRRRKRLTTHPGREPSRTGPLPGAGESAAFEWPRSRERMGIGTGRGVAPGTAALVRGVGPPESACGLGAVRPWPAGRGPRLLPRTSRVAAPSPSPLL